MAVNENGKLIMDILEHIGEPITVAKIVSEFSDATGRERDDIRERVQDTLQAGIRYGFLQRKNRKYYSEPVDEEAPESEEDPKSEKAPKSEEPPESDDDENEPEKPNNEVTDMEDRARRRRRGGRRRSRRRRSRSRSRRRR